MFNFFYRPSLLKKNPLLLTAFSAFLSVDLATGIPANVSPHPDSNQQLTQRPQAPDNKALADGIYLYGETNQPEQIGKAYVVFEIRRGQVIGAFYMPHSSFDCAYGIAAESQLDMTIVNSYDQTSYSHTVILDQFHRLPTVSPNDQRILSVCTQTYQKQVGNW